MNCFRATKRRAEDSAPYLVALMVVMFGFSVNAASPRISHITPLGVLPGGKTVLTFSGSNLEKATNLWTSFGAAGRRLTNSIGEGFSFEMTCPEEASGIGAVQVYGADGVSDFELILLDPFPVRKHEGKHQSSATAVRITFPAAVDATLKSEQVDFYRFSGKAGEEVSIEVLAHRLGSQADPVVRVLDASGREVAYCDDEDGVWRDARVSFRVPSEGEYTLLVHDVGYGGGSQYAYRLRAGNFPIVGFSYPLHDPREIGTKLASAAEIGLSRSPANPMSGAWFSSLPMLVEHEPNETEAAANEFAVPAVLNGRFHGATDRDYYRFDLAKDQKIAFQGQTRILGSPCDLALRILKSGGELIARAEGSGAGDAALTNRFSEAGAYFLEVRELSGAAPSNSPYRIVARAVSPGFTLTTESNRFDLAAGATAKIKVSCERYDYEGRIDFDLEGEGLVLEEGTIPEKKKDGELTIRLNENIPAGTLLHFSLTGIGTNKTVAAVSTRPALRKTFPLMLNTPANLDGVFAVGTKGK